mmetsp:Transcript_77425/g.129225  ORF Transcript_77425/g.129225 Transcript_77425/m.129225 type:complete len:80 (-) Transcript_77425:318-557(-)
MVGPFAKHGRTPRPGRATCRHIDAFKVIEGCQITATKDQCHGDRHPTPTPFNALLKTNRRTYVEPHARLPARIASPAWG